MNLIRIACTIVLCLLFTAVAYVPRGSAQDEPAKTHENSPEAQQPETRPEEAKPEKQENAKPEKEKQDKNQDKNKDEKETKPSKDGRGSARGQADNAGQMRPAGKSGHIPDDKFRSNFGKSHTFVMSKPMVVNGQPTFQHGGYSFVLVDPWPTGWAYADDCYVDYIDGEYFLFDVLHPGVRIALFVEI